MKLTILDLIKDELRELWPDRNRSYKARKEIVEKLSYIRHATNNPSKAPTLRKYRLL